MTSFGRGGLALVLAAAFLAGCSQPAGSGGLAASSVAPTGVVREFDLFVVGGHDLRVDGLFPFTLRFSFSPDGPGSIPAPEIRVVQGDTVRVRLHDGHHTIHWHGVRLPWGMDGVPDMTQALGDGVFTYEFVAKDAGTFWYHCHVAAPEHVDLGMFGALIVEPANSAEDPPFSREATLMLHEMDFASYALTDSLEAAYFEGSLHAETATNAPRSAFDLPEHARHNAATTTDVWSSEAAAAAGLPPLLPSQGYQPRYDHFLINGKAFPHTDPIPITTGETIRIRVINAGQLVHTMHLHGHRFLVTHKDGALLASPFLADTIGLFPGERYDLYVTGDNPGRWDFHDHGGAWGVGAFATNQGVGPGGMQTMLVYEDWRVPTALPGPVLP